MTEAIIVAIITGAFAIIGQMIISNRSSKDIFKELEKHQAVTDTKLEDLTREVREHNNFARRVPVLEEKVAAIERKNS